MRYLVLMFASFLAVSQAVSGSMCSLHCDQTSSSVTFLWQGTKVAELNGDAPYLLVEPKQGSPLEIRTLSTVGQVTTQSLTVVASAGEMLEVRQRFSTAELHSIPLIESVITLRAREDIECVLSQPFSIKALRQPVFLSPGYLYNTNNCKGSEGKFPQLAYKGEVGVPESSAFYFRADRSSHCAVMAVFDGKLLALCQPEGVTSKGQFHYNGLGLDTSHKGFDLLALSVGYKNYPARYNGNCNPRIAPRWSEGPEFGYLFLGNGEELEMKFLIYLGEAGDIFAFERPLRAFYYFLRQSLHPRSEPLKVTDLITTAIVNDTVVKECGLFRVIDKSDECDIGWTGGMMVAYPLLLAGKKTNNKEALKTAVKAIDSLCSSGFNQQAHMFYDAFRDGKWTVDGWWKHWAGGDHLGYTNGQAVYFILRSYLELSPEERATKSLWLERCQAVLDQAIAHQFPSGAFPASFSPEEGKPGEILGFGGCWLVPASLMGYQIFKQDKYLQAAQKAEACYFNWLSTLEVWGTPIDAEGAVELEGNLALVKAERMLYELTWEKKYLEHLAHSINYDFSWKWAYNTHFENSPLREMIWGSQGGNSASTCNIHLHPMSNMILDDVWFLYKETRDEYYRHRHQDSLTFGMGCINLKDEDFGFGKAGWGTEQFFHTDALQTQGPPDGGIWERYLPWATSSVLYSLVHPQ